MTARCRLRETQESVFMQMRDAIFTAASHNEYEVREVNMHAEKGRLLSVLFNKASGAQTLYSTQFATHAPPHQLTF